MISSASRLSTPFLWGVLFCVVSIVRAVAVTAAEPNDIELAMRDGFRIEANTASGTIVISARPDLERQYEWGSCKLTTKLGARVNRWYGSRGAYNPGAGLSQFFTFLYCDGISRPSVAEGQIHFKKKVDAETWIARYSAVNPKGSVWTHDGLLVQWSVVPKRKQLGVDIWQVCVDGHRPSGLSNSSDRAITFSNSSGLVGGRRDCAKVSDAVMTDTWAVWSKMWRETDEWAARQKDRTNAKK